MSAGAFKKEEERLKEAVKKAQLIQAEQLVQIHNQWRKRSENNMEEMIWLQ